MSDADEFGEVAEQEKDASRASTPKSKSSSVDTWLTASDMNVDLEKENMKKKRADKWAVDFD